MLTCRNAMRLTHEKAWLSIRARHGINKTDYHKIVLPRSRKPPTDTFGSERTKAWHGLMDTSSLYSMMLLEVCPRTPSRLCPWALTTHYGSVPKMVWPVSLRKSSISIQLLMDFRTTPSMRSAQTMRQISGLSLVQGLRNVMGTTSRFSSKRDSFSGRLEQFMKIPVMCFGLQDSRE